MTFLATSNIIPPYPKREGGINMAGGYFRPKGRCLFTVWYPWKGEKILIRKYLDGTKIYHEEQAKRVLEKIRGEIDSSTFDPSSWGKVKGLLFENAWGTYQEHSLVKKARMDQRKMIFQRYLLPYFKGKSIRDIRTIDIQNWLMEVRRGGDVNGVRNRTSKHEVAGGIEPVEASRLISSSYLRLIKVTFRAFLWFHSDNLVKMPKFPSVSVPKKAIIWLTEIEQDRILEFVPPQHQPILNFIRVYGCRPSEACNLRKADIDWGKRIVTFRDRKGGG